MADITPPADRNKSEENLVNNFTAQRTQITPFINLLLLKSSSEEVQTPAQPKVQVQAKKLARGFLIRGGQAEKENRRSLNSQIILK